MEMLVDPMLKQWVPSWLVEQYERANPFFREALTALVEHVQSNAELLRKTKREMVRRHCLHQKRKDMQDKESSDAGGDGDDDGPGDGSDPDEDADQLAARLAAGGAADDEDPNSGGWVEMLREPRPEPGSTEDAREADPDWARRNTEERVSAAGAAQPAKDRQAGSVADSRMPKGGEARFGVLFNPKGYNWTDTDDQCNVHWREHDRLEGLRKEWYGKASVGDGAVAVERDELDVWQKFAHDLVAQDRSSAKAPLRLLLLGTAGTGKRNDLSLCNR